MHQDKQEIGTGTWNRNYTLLNLFLPWCIKKVQHCSSATDSEEFKDGYRYSSKAQKLEYVIKIDVKLPGRALSEGSLCWIF